MKNIKKSIRIILIIVGLILTISGMVPIILDQNNLLPAEVVIFYFIVATIGLVLFLEGAQLFKHKHKSEPFFGGSKL